MTSPPWGEEPTRSQKDPNDDEDDAEDQLPLKELHHSGDYQDDSEYLQQCGHDVGLPGGDLLNHLSAQSHQSVSGASGCRLTLPFGSAGPGYPPARAF